MCVQVGWCGKSNSAIKRLQKPTIDFIGSVCIDVSEVIFIEDDPVGEVYVFRSALNPGYFKLGFATETCSRLVNSELKIDEIRKFKLKIINIWRVRCLGNYRAWNSFMSYYKKHSGENLKGSIVRIICQKNLGETDDWPPNVDKLPQIMIDPLIAGAQGFKYRPLSNFIRLNPQKEGLESMLKNGKTEIFFYNGRCSKPDCSNEIKRMVNDIFISSHVVEPENITNEVKKRKGCKQLTDYF